MFATITRYGTDDPVKLAKRIGIEVHYKPLPTEVFGMMYRTPIRTAFIVNSHSVREAQRFTIAHCLGHVVKQPEREAGVLSREHILHPDDMDIVATRFAIALLKHAGEYDGFAGPCEFYAEKCGYPLDELEQAYRAIQRVR